MRNTENHLSIASFLSGRRESHVARIITRALIVYPVAPEHHGMVRDTALTLIEMGTAFLVTGNSMMGTIAMNRLEWLQRLAPAIAKIADCVATMFAAAYQMDRRQARVSYKRLRLGKVGADVLAYCRAVCQAICPSKPELRVVRWAA